ncbi:MAG: ABC transporter ATP-binding protein [Bacteroidales bacterium]
MNSEAFVVVNNLSKSYQDITALKNISFTINKNELFGFIGPDGAGKTSIFRILATVLLADKGSAFINGFDVVRDYRSIRQITGYMPGRFSLYQDLSVQENLEFFATVFGTTIEKNYELIKPVYSHIEPFKNRLARKLSGGMKQKLALSCALIHRPEILILDEPTTGVDAVSRKEFWEMLKGLKEQGITILVSTPYMDEAALCDRVALIQQGELMKIDTPDGIVDAYPCPLYALQADDLYSLLLDLRQWENTRSVFAFGQELHLTVQGSQLDESSLAAWLNTKGHTSLKIREIKASIEDCFMELLITRKS